MYRALLAGLMIASGGLEAQTGWKAGVASVTVTPREQVWLAGFAARNRPSEGIAADLKVKALALEYTEGKPVVIVTADLVGFHKSFADKIAERCNKQYGLARERLLLNASHTHSGPILSGGPGGRFPASEKYSAELLESIVGVVGRAVNSLAPASVQFDQGLAGFAVNRRRSRPNTRQLPGPVDHDVPVLAVRASDGKLRAILFGYACHPTTMAAYQINADYPGYAQTLLEELNPGAVALFMQGCGADSNPLPRYHGEDAKLVERSLELSKMYGRILAFSVDFVLRGKMMPVTGPLTTAFEHVEIPFEPRPTRQELEARRSGADADRRGQAERLLRALDQGVEIPERYPFAIQVLHFGSGLKMIALGGEMVVDYALRLKAAHGWDDTWVAGYSNELPGYIPSKRVLLEGGYETGGAAGRAFSTAVEEIIIERVATMVRRSRTN